MTVEERNALVLQWLRLPRWVYVRLVRSGRYPFIYHVPLQDALAVGNLALVEAARRWDPEKCSFSTAAVLRISRRMIRFAREDYVIRVPDNRRQLEINRRRARVARLCESLDALREDSGEDVEPSAAASSDREEMAEFIASALLCLTWREREVVRLRFGLADEFTYTLEEIGRVFRISRERVKQIEVRALWKLSHSPGMRSLID